MTIIHLVVDDKFIDAAIREFEVVEPGCHEYLTFQTPPPWKYVRSPLVRSVDLGQWRQRVAAPDVDAVVFHSMYPGHAALLAAVPAGPRVVWLGWGYDYYGMMMDEFPQGLLLPETTVLVASLHRRARRWRPGKMDCSELSVARPHPKPSASERTAFARVDLFIPVLDVEHAIVCRRQPWFRAGYLPWNYLTLEDDLQLPTPAPAEPGPNLLVGNSAAPTNNHLESFEHIRRTVDLAGRKLIVPLSYGDAAYAAQVSSRGRRLFGDAFVPLMDFLPKQRYLELLDSCGYVLMNHVRQQAMGNLVTGGLRGARLFMNPANPAASWLRRHGVRVDDIDTIETTPLPRAVRDSNRAAITAFTSRQHSRGMTRRLIDELLHTRVETL